MKPLLTEALAQGRVLLSDGAWGTELQRRGLPPGESSERWCLERPEEVAAIARAYAEAGAEIIETNSFGGNRLKLEHYGLADRCAEINEAAARLSREGAGPDRWIAGSIGPTGRLLLMEDTTEEELYAVFAEQAEALARGGADAICVETMSATDEAAIAVRAARERTGGVVICTFTFSPTAQGDYRTMMGVTPEDAVAAALAAGAHISGANCGTGARDMVAIIRRMRAAHPGVPLMAQANAGLPRIVDGRTVFPETPAETAVHASALVEAGAQIVGGCCGTTPDHIRALRAALDELFQIRPPVGISKTAR